jgi:hypothetical protein
MLQVAAVIAPPQRSSWEEDDVASRGYKFFIPAKKKDISSLYLLSVTLTAL